MGSCPLIALEKGRVRDRDRRRGRERERENEGAAQPDAPAEAELRFFFFFSPALSCLFCCVGTNKNLINVSKDHHHCLIHLSPHTSYPVCLPELDPSVELGVRQAIAWLSEVCNGSVAARRRRRREAAGGGGGGGKTEEGLWWASSASQTHYIDLLIG